MAYNFKLVTTIPATPEAIYDAWLDGAAHSAMTGAEATASDKVGASFTAWDGYIHGRNIELVKGRRIVQSWRTSEFSDGEPEFDDQRHAVAGQRRRRTDPRTRQRAGRSARLRRRRLGGQLLRADEEVFQQEEAAMNREASLSARTGAAS